MKHILVLIAILSSLLASSQVKTPPAGGNKKASIAEQIGITDVKINYDRPAVKGREGKIWGSVVHYGFADLHYGTSKAAPWRAGANENTTIEFSTDIFINGRPLPEGKYGFFVAMAADKATLIFSRDNNAWGSFFYKPENDALRIDVPIKKTNESIEWLKYEFEGETDSSAIISLEWEKIKISFSVSVDLKTTQVNAYRYAINNGSFYKFWQNMQTAASYCLKNNINLEEGLTWAERSVNEFFGEKNYLTLTTYAGLLEKLERQKEADSVLNKALSMATVQQLVNFAGASLKQKKNKQAFEVYKMAYDKSPDDVITNYGMTKAYAAIGNTNEAIKFANKAISLAPNQTAKEFLEKLREDIKNGKDISEQ